MDSADESYYPKFLISVFEIETLDTIHQSDLYFFLHLHWFVDQGKSDSVVLKRIHLRLNLLHLLIQSETRPLNPHQIHRWAIGHRWKSKLDEKRILDMISYIAGD